MLRAIRMFEMKPIMRRVLFACGSIAGAAMLAAPVSAQTPLPPQTLEPVIITGSNVRRTDTETVAPVQIITREDLERSGKPTVAEALRSIPGNTGGSFDESFSNSFAPGASGISLRGLGQKSTLVLINGRRTANYGAAQNIQDSFVDLNSIPTSAVERIEILKDGASAIYGSDAIAGVVNVILRSDFKGVEVAASIGQFHGKNDYRASVGLGFGDLGSRKFNIFGVLDVYKRDLLQFSDTEFQKDRDFRDRDGGRNFVSLEGGGTWRNEVLNAAGQPVPGTVRQAIAGCQGQVLTAAQAVERGLLLATAATNLSGNTFCTRDFNYAFTALPGTERVGLLSRGTFDLSSAVQLFAELGFSRNETEQHFQEPFFAFATGLRQTPAGLSPFTYNIRFAPGAAGNPLSTNAFYSGVLNDLGLRSTDITSDTLRSLAGAKWSLKGWDFDSAIGYSKNELDIRSTNFITLAGTSAALGVPTAAQPPIPLAGSVGPINYNLDNPSLNSQSVRDSIRANSSRLIESGLTLIDTKANTEIGQLPGGPVGLALGVEYRHETLNDEPAAIARQGQILSGGITATTGGRHSLALFSELALPLTRTVEMQAALRNDRYSDFGSALTPKLGVKFKPTPEFLMRANWGRGFRAPTLVESSDSIATFFGTVLDPLGPPPNPPGTLVQVSGVLAGNKNLLPEKSRSATLGFVFEPSNSFNLSVDYYEINWSNVVVLICCQAIVNSGDPIRVIRDPATQRIVTVVGGYENQANTFTRGYDFEARYNTRVAPGRFVTRVIASYVDSFKENGTERAGRNGGTNTLPRLRATISQAWEQGPYVVSATVSYIHSYRQQLLSASFFTFQDPRFQNGTYPIKVPAYATLDLFMRYNVTPKLSVSATVLNVTDTLPPYDPGISSTSLYDFSQYDVRGRQYRVGATYKF